jgi:CxxC motif-containing protein (DUF1111 family)
MSLRILLADDCSDVRRSAKSALVADSVRLHQHPSKTMPRRSRITLLALVFGLQSICAVPAVAGDGFRARDPGVRSGDPAAGGPIADLTADERRFFEDGREHFLKPDGVGDGLGPRFNLDRCDGCHAQPATGGTAPAVNPQVAIAQASGARNAIPSFITPNGPVRVARFKVRRDGTRDGSVHPLFVVSGRQDDTGNAAACNIRQEDFEREVARGNVIFRIPTPIFGAGLIEQIPERAIVANQRDNVPAKRVLGISGHPNRNGHDRTITRFGWKAQNPSLLLFTGEAYNVEMGITTELFPTERDETPACQFAKVPNEVTTRGATHLETLSTAEKLSLFSRFLAPPTPSASDPGGAGSIARGQVAFTAVGCALCHTPTLRTSDSAVAALSSKDVNLFSDLLVHRMGRGLADDVVQGEAGPDEFRTAPLWGLGQRIFLLHDGRTTDLLEAIRVHRSRATRKVRASEANLVIDRFNALGESEKQDLLNFLRSL